MTDDQTATLQRETPVAASRASSRALGALLAVALALLAFSATVLAIRRHGSEPILPPAGISLEGTAPFTFGVVGDSKDNMTVFTDILRRLKGEDVKFIVHTGDIVKRANERQFAWMRHVIRRVDLPMPFCVVIGNHDIDDQAPTADARARFYERAFGPRQYWFTYANTLVVVFDDSDWYYTDEDLAWLDATLARLRDRYDLCFVAMHVPIHDPRPGHVKHLERGNDELAAVLAKHRVSGILNSHIHTYLEYSVHGIPAWITGGAGSELEDPATDEFHYLTVAVQPDGSFDVKKTVVPKRPDGTLLDYFLRVRYPATIVFWVSAACVALLGLALLGRRPSRRTANVGDPPRDSGGTITDT